jgi:hypothetical protein
MKPPVADRFMQSMVFKNNIMVFPDFSGYAKLEIVNK